jgi:virginiamycin B lyase
VLVLTWPARAGAQVYWSSGNGNVTDTPQSIVGRADLDGTEVNPSLVTDYLGQQPIAADANHLYYFSEERSAEVRANLDGGEEVELPGAGFVAAIDGEHIYWMTDSETIGRAKLDGSDSEPEFIKGILGQPEPGGIAVYGGFVYWAGYAGGFGDAIGRASLSTRTPENGFVEFNPNNGEFNEFPANTGPRGIAVDEAGIFWTNNSYDSTVYSIGHVGLVGGTANQDFIPGANVGFAGIAIEGSDLYWDSYNESNNERTISRAEVQGADAEGHGVALDLNLIKLGDGNPKWLAVDAASSPPPAPPPPPPPIPSSPPNQGPSSSFSFGKVKLLKKSGSASLTVALPGPGRLVLKGKGLITLTEAVKATGNLSLTIKPTKKTAKKLKKSGKAKVTAEVTFTPTGGAPHTESKSLTLKG